MVERPIPQTSATRALEVDATTVSLKRAAWAFGCAKKGSEEERHLLDLLLAVTDRERAAGLLPPPAAGKEDGRG